MIKRKVLMMAGLCLFMATASAVVMQGESSPGVYQNIATNESGHIILAADNFTGMASDAKQDQIVSAINNLNSKTPPLVNGKVPVDFGAPLTVNSQQYTYRNITGNGTFVIKPTSGSLRRIVFNTPGITSNIIVYDGVNSSGVKIAGINSALGQLSLTYEVQFSTGLTIVANGLTPADMTIVYQ